MQYTHTIKCKNCGHDLVTPFSQIDSQEGSTLLVCEHRGTRIQLTLKDPGIPLMQGLLADIDVDKKRLTSEAQNDAAWIKIQVACEAAGVQDLWAFVESSRSLDPALDSMRNGLPEDRRKVFDGILEGLGLDDEQKRHLATIIGKLFHTETPEDKEFKEEQKAAIRRGGLPRVKEEEEIEHIFHDGDDLDGLF